MSDRQRLQQQIDDLQKRWQNLSAKISSLQGQRDEETRPENRFRLDYLIHDEEGTRKDVDAQLQELEREQKKAEKAELITEAWRLERNEAFTEAERAWERIRALDPQDSQIERELQRFRARQEQ